LLRHLNDHRASRSFRRVQDLIEELADLSCEGTISLEAARAFLATA